MKLIQTITAIGESAGKTYTLHVYQNYVREGTRENPDRPIPTTKVLQLSNGQSVNYREKGVYQIVDTGERLTSDDPNAP